MDLNSGDKEGCTEYIIPSTLPESVPGLVQAEVETSLLSGRKLTAVFSAFCLAFSLVALDQTILSTALPIIASHFDAVSELSWIASAYSLPQAGFMLFFGKVLSISPPKVVFLVCICIFELGSLFCAIAPSANFLIFGRAVAGFGATGMWVSIMSIIARVTTLKQRPILMGLFGMVFAASSIVGPLIGGALSDHLTWRWCFYINLPIGGLALVVVILFLPHHSPLKQSDTVLKAWLKIDWVGTLLSFGMVTFLLIALQWGGNAKPWDDPLVITFLVLFAVCAVTLLVWERRIGPQAILPLKMLKRNSILGASLATFFISIFYVMLTYYLPLLYQVRGDSAEGSGIDVLPLMISGVLAIFVSGAVASATGYAWPFLVFAPALSAVGCGLLFTVSTSTDRTHLIGYQILSGVGLGCAAQLPVVVAQAEYADEQELIPQATSLVTWLQLIGNAVGLAISGAVFAGQLREQLHKNAPNIPPSLLSSILSSVEVLKSLQEPVQTQAITAYVAATTRVFLIGVPTGALACMVSLLIRRGRLRKSETAGIAM